MRVNVEFPNLPTAEQSAELTCAIIWLSLSPPCKTLLWGVCKRRGSITASLPSFRTYCIVLCLPNHQNMAGLSGKRWMMEVCVCVCGAGKASLIAQSGEKKKKKVPSQSDWMPDVRFDAMLQHRFYVPITPSIFFSFFFLAVRTERSHQLIGELCLFFFFNVRLILTN